MDQVEKKVYGFVKDYIDYLKKGDDNFKLNIFTSKDIESRRDNVGWYNYNKGHIININAANLACATYFIGNGLFDIDAFFAFITLGVGHEYRHFMQGTVIYDDKTLEGFTKEDAIDAHLVMYIRYFFDAYYLLNKGNIKYEIDAEKFGVISGVKFLEDYNPNVDAKKAMLNAVNFYANLMSRGFIEPTLPLDNRSYEQIVERLNNNLGNDQRCNDLDCTLRVYDQGRYMLHEEYGLDEYKVITPELIYQYRNLNNIVDKDLLVANRILSLLDKKEESLEQFSCIQSLFDGKRLVK